MNVKVWQILIVFVLASILGIVASYSSIQSGHLEWFFIPENTKIALDVMKTISIIFAAIIGLLYFDPMGLRKKTMEKQFENVSKILDNIVGKRILFFVNQEMDGKKNANGWYYIYKYQLEETLSGKEDMYRSFLDHKLAFEVNDFSKAYAEVIKLHDSAFTPPGIRESLDFTRLYFVKKTESYEARNQMFINLASGMPTKEKIIENLTKNVYFTNLLEKDVTFREFLTYHSNVIIECEKWLKGNTFLSSKFNI